MDEKQILSDQGRQFIKLLEGCKLTAYLDTSGIWTIGVGHIAGVRKGMVITQEQADKFFIEDIIPVEQCIRERVKVKLQQHEFDALCAFIFNVGIGAFKSSTLLKLLNAGDKMAAALQFQRWNKGADPKTGKKVPVQGLTNRRQKEYKLFISGAY